MMDIFKLFKAEPNGSKMMQAPTPQADEKLRQSELIWQRFWGQYDAVMEMACLRKSVNVSPEHANKIEEMFVETLEELAINAEALVSDYKKNQKASNEQR